jgi:tetratricopeptide (TPR) repeat protein
VLHGGTIPVRTQVTFAFAALFTTHVALAQTDDSGRDAARGLYKQGLELVAQSDFEHALEAFQGAYRASPQFAVLYNIGQTCIALGKPVDAVSALEQYLSEGKAEIPAERLEQVTRQISTLKSKTAEIAITTRAPGANLEIDGRDLGRAPLSAPTRVSAGDHVVSARAEDGSKVSRSVTLQAGERLDLRLDPPTPELARPNPTGSLTVVCREQVRVWIDGAQVVSSPTNPRISLDAGRHRITLVAAGTRSAEQRLDVQPGSTVTMDCAEFLPKQRAAPPAQSSGANTTLGYVLGGIGAGLAATAFGHYLWNLGRYEEWQKTHSALAGDQEASDYVERQTRNNELGSSIERASRVTVSLAVGGGALLATGITLVVLDGGSRSANPAGNTGLALSLGSVW